MTLLGSKIPKRLTARCVENWIREPGGLGASCLSVSYADLGQDSRLRSYFALFCGHCKYKHILDTSIPNKCIWLLRRPSWRVSTISSPISLKKDDNNYIPILVLHHVQSPFIFILITSYYILITSLLITSSEKNYEGQYSFTFPFYRRGCWW